MSDVSIAVLRWKIHGLSSTEYVELLRERLPDCSILEARTREEEREVLQSATVATGLDLPNGFVDEPNDLELFACIFAGTSHLPLERYEANDVAVTNASGVHAPKIGEYVLGAMIALTHRFPRAWQQQQTATWQSYSTRELSGSRAVVVGIGAIGTAVFERLEAFGVETVGVRHSPEKGGPADEIYGFEAIEEAVVGADYLVLACPLTDQTAGLVDRDVLETLEPDAFVINIARGPVVETDALVAALQRNSIGGAALDVTDPEPLPSDHELWAMDDVLITPHNAGHTPAYLDRCADILEENVHRLRAGEEFLNRVVSE